MVKLKSYDCAYPRNIGFLFVQNVVAAELWNHIAFLDAKIGIVTNIIPRIETICPQYKLATRPRVAVGANPVKISCKSTVGDIVRSRIYDEPIGCVGCQLDWRGEAEVDLGI